MRGIGGAVRTRFEFAHETLTERERDRRAYITLMKHGTQKHKTKTTHKKRERK